MKTLYFNGHIYTGKGEFTHALLVDNGLIERIGDDAATHAGGATAVDLQGKTVLPGFNDSHLHLFGVGKNLSAVGLLGSKSIADVIARGKRYIKDNGLKPGEFLVGRGWNQDYFEGESRLITRYDLDKISTEHPIIFRRACGHLLTCNSLALQMAGIDRNTQPVYGGAIDHDENGEPNGIFRELSLGQVERIVPPMTQQQIEAALEKGMAYAASHGITSLQPNDINDRDYKTMDNAFRNLVAQGRMKTRVNEQCCFTDIAIYRQFLEDGFQPNQGDCFYKIGPLKLYVDGSLGARTALMRKPYADDPSTMGIPCMNQEQLNAFVQLATEHKMQVIVHAIGDKAIEMVLDAFEQCGGSGNPYRHGVVHAQITDKALVQRFKALNVLALVQPIFLHYDMHVVESRVGKELAHTSYAFGTMNEIGVHTSFGSDSPVEDLNTMENLHCAINRQDLKNYPQGGYVPSERFSLEEALKCYTEEGAYCSFEEGKKGRLIPGQYADFVVLSEDIFAANNQIKSIGVEMTVMNGAVTYQK